MFVHKDRPIFFVRYFDFLCFLEQVLVVVLEALCEMYQGNRNEIDPLSF